MKIGDYIYQKGSDFKVYGVIIKKFKNGNFQAKVFISYNDSIAGKAKLTSMMNWYPVPVVINESDIPVKILTKIKGE